MSLLDPRFKYTPSHSTDIRRTWQRFGFKPVERQAVKGAEWQTRGAQHTAQAGASNEARTALGASLAASIAA